MANDLRQLIAQAIKEGVEARAAFYAALEEPDMQKLGPPANTHEITEVEQFFGITLPPSYRAFLELHNGWLMFDAATDLFSTTSLLKEAKSPRLKKWREIASEEEGIESSSLILIGASKVAAMKYFIDPTQVGADGEMCVIEHEKVVEEKYKNFLDFLLQLNAVYRNGVPESNLDDGFDFSDV
jgi:hypothetical protein